MMKQWSATWKMMLMCNCLRLRFTIIFGNKVVDVGFCFCKKEKKTFLLFGSEISGPGIPCRFCYLFLILHLGLNYLVPPRAQVASMPSHLTLRFIFVSIFTLIGGTISLARN